MRKAFLSLPGTVIIDYMNKIGWTIYLLFSIFSFGCIAGDSPPWISKIPIEPFDENKDFIIKLPEGEILNFEQLLDYLEKTRIIFIGETHDQMPHHLVQLRILQNLVKRGHEVVVAMEMFERHQQPILDRWSQGVLDEEEFLKEVRWESLWGMDFQLYQGILKEIKSQKLKLLGLNIERDLVRRVAQNGIEGLVPTEGENLPPIDLTDNAYRSYLRSIYQEHQEGIAKDFEKFYQAQILWDEAMAETLSQYLQSPEGEGKKILTLTGSGHVSFSFGIPNRLYRRTPIPYQILLLKEWKKDVHRELAFFEAPHPIAHFVWITPPSPLERKRPKIGMILKEKEDPNKGVWIEQVLPKSVAQKAGLQPKDQILLIDGKEIQSLKDLHEAVARKPSEATILFTILREGKKREIKIILP